ncbi:AzlC family ABC transporter permease [soil metagenome]
MTDATPPAPLDGRTAGSPPDPVVGSLVLGLAVGAFGISFGVLAVASGLTVAQACVMSLLVFTGASQFAVVGVIGSGGSTAAALGSALLLAARNAAYGLAMSDVIRGRLPTRLLGAQLVIDESTAMASAQHTSEDRRRGFWLAGASVFVFWNLGTLLGALGGDAIGNPETFGLDAAFPAGFVALVVPHLAKFEGRVVAVAGVALALALVPVVPVGVPVLAASLAVLLGLRSPAGGPAPVEGASGDLEPSP